LLTRLLLRLHAVALPLLLLHLSAAALLTLLLGLLLRALLLLLLLLAPALSLLLPGPAVPVGSAPAFLSAVPLLMLVLMLVFIAVALRDHRKRGSEKHKSGGNAGQP
jgi:hypothetical protein